MNALVVMHIPGLVQIPVFSLIFLEKKKALPGLSGNFVSMTGLSFFGCFCPGFSFLHHYLCRSRAILVGTMIDIQSLFWRLGMSVVPWGERWFFLWMMGRMRMRVVQGMVFVLFHVPVLVKACRCTRMGFVVVRCRMWFASWCHRVISFILP